jgi:putative flippase GtrA
MLFLQSFINSLIPRDVREHIWKYYVSVFFSFLFELALLWLLIDIAGMHYIPAIIVSFAFSVSIQFCLIRFVLFRITHTSLFLSYAQFFTISGVGLVLMIGGTVMAVEIFALSYILARIIAAAISSGILFVLHRNICILPRRSLPKPAKPISKQRIVPSVN